MLAEAPDRWNSKSRLKCCSYYNLRGLSSFMRYTLGITEEGITGGINHGNGEKESVWDEGRVRSSRAARSSSTAQTQSRALSLSHTSPELCLGKKGCLQVQSALIFPNAAPHHAERAHVLIKSQRGGSGAVGGANSTFSAVPAAPLKPQSNFAWFCSRCVF